MQKETKRTVKQRKKAYREARVQKQRKRTVKRRASCDSSSARASWCAWSLALSSRPITCGIGTGFGSCSDIASMLKRFSSLLSSYTSILGDI